MCVPPIIYNNAGIAFIGMVATTHFDEFEPSMRRYWEWSMDQSVSGTCDSSGDVHATTISSDFGDSPLPAKPGTRQPISRSPASQRRYDRNCSSDVNRPSRIFVTCRLVLPRLSTSLTVLRVDTPSRQQVATTVVNAR